MDPDTRALTSAAVLQIWVSHGGYGMFSQRLPPCAQKHLVLFAAPKHVSVRNTRVDQQPFADLGLVSLVDRGVREKLETGTCPCVWR